MAQVLQYWMGLGAGHWAHPGHVSHIKAQAQAQSPVQGRSLKTNQIPTYLQAEISGSCFSNVQHKIIVGAAVRQASTVSSLYVLEQCILDNQLDSSAHNAISVHETRCEEAETV